MGILRQYRQGDMMLEEINSMPAEAQVVKNRGRIVLAEGSTKTDAHMLKATEAQEQAHSGERYFRVKKRTKLECLNNSGESRHDALSIEKGDYRLVLQREYTPEAIRNVLD